MRASLSSPILPTFMPYPSSSFANRLWLANLSLVPLFAAISIPQITFVSSSEANIVELSNFSFYLLLFRSNLSTLAQHQINIKQKMIPFDHLWNIETGWPNQVNSFAVWFFFFFLPFLTDQERFRVVVWSENISKEREEVGLVRRRQKKKKKK